MRIRTDGDYEYRLEAIEAASERWGCNKTRAIMLALEWERRMDRSLAKALNHPDMTEELADILSQPNKTLEYRVETGIERDG